MQFVIDTEFNGFGGELISLALVARDGRTFYEVLKPPKKVDAWVSEHVLPVLGQEPIPRDAFVRSLRSFLGQWGDEELEVIADWPEDLAHFFASLIVGPGQMCLVPKHPIRTQLVFSLPSTADTSTVPHNALEDALALSRSLGWS